MESCWGKDRLHRLLCTGFIRVVTSQGDWELTPSALLGEETIYHTPVGKITVSVYDKGGDTVYRSMTLYCQTDVTLYRLDFLTELASAPVAFMEYKSFVHAPTAAFIRYAEEGLYTGVENPFFSASLENKTVCLSYEPSLLLKPGDVYESEPQFLGGYRLSGHVVKEKEPICWESIQSGIRRPRFFNPCGDVALDLAEIDAMRRYVTEYYDVIQKRFDNLLYFFFYPKKPWPETEEEVGDYLATLDRFAAISGDIVAFNPHAKTTLPTEEKPFWELAPAHSPAETILRYAQSKGLRCGYYMGCAFHGDGGNAALLPYRPDRAEWKKVDVFGHTAAENCLGCDDYVDWWYTVQKNTIERYDLGYWSWDPGPGNGNDCYATNHGHIPGKGEYKGWRNSQKLLERLKTDFPKLFLMSFYGRKEYGIWGFRYFSQHEVYWEQTILFGATLHQDLHDDRMNAHGTRLQNQWSMHFRFLPAHLGHGLVPRMGENHFDPSMDRAYDFGGWQYALLSAIACCGSVTHCNLPDRLENVPGYTAFYQKWIRWAKEHYRYCDFTKPIADEVSNNVIDGFARIDGDSGQLFLFNSSPKILRKQLILDERLGLKTIKPFYLRILYGDERIEREERDLQYRGAYRMGDVLDITLPPYGAVVLALADEAVDAIREIPRYPHTIDCFTEPDGKPFRYPVHGARERVTLSAHAVFTSDLRRVLSESHIPGEAELLKKIPQWQKDGMPFTFASALPHRLVLYIPFDGPKQPREVHLFLNGKEVPIEIFRLWDLPISHYAFVEDYVKWDEDNDICLIIEGLAANSFMGIHVDYPDRCYGMQTKEIVFSERLMPSNLHSDPSLVVDSFTLTPDTLDDIDTVFTVTVTTSVNPQIIEGVYFLHPTGAAMPALAYNSERNCWEGTYHSGVRSRNIFCNSTIYAWIKGKDGGIGPQAEWRPTIRYVASSPSQNQD